MYAVKSGNDTEIDEIAEKKLHMKMHLKRHVFAERYIESFNLKLQATFLKYAFVRIVLIA